MAPGRGAGAAGRILRRRCQARSVERPRGVAAPRVVHRQADPGHRSTLSAPSETPTPRDNGRTRNSPRRRVPAPATVPWTPPTAHRNTSHKIPVPYTGRRACPNPSAPRRAAALPARGPRSATAPATSAPNRDRYFARNGSAERMSRRGGRTAVPHQGPTRPESLVGPDGTGGAHAHCEARGFRPTSTAIDVGARHARCGVSLTPDRDAEPSHTRTVPRALTTRYVGMRGGDHAVGAWPR